MPVALEEPLPVDLGEASQALHLEQLDRTMELREVLLDQGIRQLGQGLRSKLLDSRSEPAHRSQTSNMRSMVVISGCPRSEICHTRRTLITPFSGRIAGRRLDDASVGPSGRPSATEVGRMDL